MLVRFLKRHGVYNAGEVAGFSPDQAAALIGAGFAVEDKPPAPELPAKSETDSDTPEAKPGRKK